LYSPVPPELEKIIPQQNTSTPPNSGGSSDGLNSTYTPPNSGGSLDGLNFT